MGLIFRLYCIYLEICSFLQRLDKQGVSFCTRTTHDDNAITNAVEIYDSTRYFYSTLAESYLCWSMYMNSNWFIYFCSGELHFMAANNDCSMREYDMEGFQLVNHFHFPWPVNVCLFQVLHEWSDLWSSNCSVSNFLSDCMVKFAPISFISWLYGCYLTGGTMPGLLLVVFIE